MQTNAPNKYKPKGLKMFDTVRICIPFDKLTIMDYDIFKPHPRYIDRETYCYVKIPEDLKSMGFPKMTVKVIPQTGRAPIKEFRIEISSIPKLIFGENVSECQDTDFQLVINALQYKLNLLGIHIDTVDIENAYVSRLDYGKNIPVDIRSKTIISALKNLPQSKHLSTDENNYKNHGQEFRVQSDYVDYKAYDKMLDIQKNDKSATVLMTDGTRKPLSAYLKEDMGIEDMIRFEFSMQSRAQIAEIFGKCDIESNLTFKDVFNSEYARKVNLYAFDRFIKKHATYAFLTRTQYGVILDKCVKANKTIRQALVIVGLRVLQIKDNGVQALKDRYKNTSIDINSIEQDILDLDLKNCTIKKTLEYIRDIIDKNIPLRIV